MNAFASAVCGAIGVHVASMYLSAPFGRAAWGWEVGEDTNCGSWSAWGACSDTCGGGWQTRSRVGADCNPLSEGQMCNEDKCPASTGSSVATCGSWTSWGDCSKTCGGGTQTRTRSGGGCSSTSESQACNEASCPTCGAWTSWGDCSKTCGGGTQTKTRSGDGCSSTSESQQCNTANCPVTTVSSLTTCGSWSSWGACSVTCGAGTQTKTRSGSGCASTSMSQACNKAVCPMPENNGIESSVSRARGLSYLCVVHLIPVFLHWWCC